MRVIGRHDQRGFGRLHLEVALAQRGLRRRQRGIKCVDGGFRRIDARLRDDALGEQLSRALALLARKSQVGFATADIRRRKIARRARRRNGEFHLALRAHVQERGIERLDGGDHRLLRFDHVARVGFDAQHLSGDGRGEDVDLPHPRNAVVLDRHRHRPFARRRDVDRHRAAARAQKPGRDQKRRRGRSARTRV